MTHALGVPRKVAIFALIVAMTFGLFGRAVSAAETVDQQQTSSDVTTTTTPDDSLAQTFTAGLTGGLTRVSAEINNIAAGGQDITATIQTLTSTGAPSGTVLASSTVHFAAADFTFRWVDFVFASPASVSAGASYALVLDSSGVGNFTVNGFAWTGSSDPASYPAGSAWIYASLANTWIDSPVLEDFAFKTYVDVPPPLPTTTRDCMSSGWQHYAVFANQGDCVSFVATKGKNQPH